MNNNNQSGNNSNNNGAVSKEPLTKFAAIAYNTAGFLPSKVVFNVTLSQLKPLILKSVQEFVDEIQNVTFITNFKSGEIATFVWLPSDSKHLRDTSTLKDNSAIKLPITRYSSELKDFMERFCHSENKRTINEEGGMRLAGIQIDLARVIRIIFDEQGAKFSKDFNYPKVYTNIRLTANFGKGSDGNNFGNLRYIEITKSTKSAIEESEPKPKKSFKAI